MGTPQIEEGSSLKVKQRNCLGASRQETLVRGVFNGFCGAESGNVPVSTVAPAVLLQEIELQRAVEGKDRPPILMSPAASGTASGEVK